LSQVPAFRLQQAVAVLHRGGVIAYPTEAVWGLGCDPFNSQAVQRLLDLKQRPQSKGLILVAASMAQLGWLLHDLSRPERDQLAASWPGPVTWLVPHRGRLPRWIHGDHDTVALRVSAHPGVQGLCAAFGGPLVSTSANRTGCRAPRERHQVYRMFGTQLDYLLPGAVQGASRPSTIRDLRSGRVLRS
jgi:L-threonylcarbamoyladenylate synthase